ncbi:MAG: 5'/3'-nucleotidase SurE [Actinobacteria bacterium]|nr:5'/3'-nucleotidase SurE [Actinomycetota bacterium]
MPDRFIPSLPPLVRLPARRPAILVTNDDGIDSPGLLAVKRALDPLGDVRVIAPDRNRTGAARSITMRSPLWVEEVPLADGGTGYATDGTPVDCVRLAALGLLDRQPDLIVSGINLSGNLGDDVTYSGTVAAAFEGIMLGVPAIAFSADGYHARYDLDVPARVAHLLVRTVLERGFPAKTLLNVNCPDLRWEDLGGVRLTTLGTRIYGDRVQLQETDGRRRRYFIYGDDLSYHQEDGTDFDAIGDGYVSLTPIHFDLTSRDAIRLLEDWPLDLRSPLGWEPGEPSLGESGARAAAIRLVTPSPSDTPSAGDPPMSPLPGFVIFDLDGTVLDSVELIVESFGHAVREVLGLEPSREDLIRGVGRPLLEQMACFDRERAEELVRVYREFNHREHDLRVSLYPGVADLLLWLRARGARLGLVTSKSRDATEMAFRVTGIGPLFEAVVCAGETEHHKPHPDPLFRVVELLGGDVDGAVYIGDSPFDVEAAQRAGMRSVGVTWGVFPAENVAAQEPDYLVGSMEALSALLGDVRNGRSAVPGATTGGVTPAPGGDAPGEGGEGTAPGGSR